MKCNQIAAAVNLFHTSAHPQSPLPISRRLRVGLMAVAAVSLFSHTSQANPVVTDLGTLHGGYSQATAINNSDVVVGISDNQAFVWDAINGMVALPSLFIGGRSGALALNDQSQVVGYAELPPPANGPTNALVIVHAVRWQQNNSSIWKIKDLGTIQNPSVNYSSTASAINNLSKVAGMGQTATFETHALSKHGNAAIKDLLTLPGGTFSEALGINSTAYIVGWSDSSSSPFGRPHAVVCSPGSTFGAGHDLGTFTIGGSSRASAINNIDTSNPMPYVVGDSDASAFIHKFIGVASLLNPASATTGGDNLGVLPGDVRSSAAAINSSRDVVGTSMGAYTYGTYSRAFVYPDPINTANQMQDLNALAFSPTFILVEASGINSSGKIVGSAANFTAFSTHAFLFEP